MTLEACLSTIRSLLTDAGIRTLTWDHPVSEPTHESTPAAKPLIDRLGQLYPDLLRSSIPRHPGHRRRPRLVQRREDMRAGHDDSIFQVLC